MQRALSGGVENIRIVLEKSAVNAAGELRDKVLELTAALSDAAGKALSDADLQLGAQAERTANALLARASEIAVHFEAADQRLSLRADETFSLLSLRAEDTARTLQDKAARKSPAPSNRRMRALPIRWRQCRHRAARACE